MEPFLDMTGGPCYECGGKTKYARGGQAADEQARQLMGYLTQQMSKGASPSVLLKSLVQSGVPQQDAQELIGMATQAFKQEFQQGSVMDDQPQQQQDFTENPFEQGQQPNMRDGGSFLQKMIGGGMNFKMTGKPDAAELKDWKTETDNNKLFGMNNFGNESSVIQMQAENPGMYDMFKDQKTIKVEDHNKISNIDNNGFNRSMAFMSGLSNPNNPLANVPVTGGLSALFKGALGAAGTLGSAYMGTAKFTAPNKSRVYDDKYYAKAREGGEWNPFEDDRQKFNIGMQTYNTGGVTYEGQTAAGEKKPLSYTDWANGQKDDDAKTVKGYQDYLNKFKIIGAPKATQQGDSEGKVVAGNMLSGTQMMAESSQYFADQEKLKAMQETQRNAGNTMESASVVNNPNQFGMMTVNNNLANQGPSMGFSAFDLGTTMAKYGGSTQYKEGGTYSVSPEELQMIMALGGDVEFLD